MMHLSASGKLIEHFRPILKIDYKIYLVVKSKSIMWRFSSHSDEEFVETEIINFLEERGFKICYHNRDFTPGTRIGENMADATENSRRMIFIVSRYYMDCMFQDPYHKTLLLLLNYLCQVLNVICQLCHLFCHSHKFHLPDS